MQRYRGGANAAIQQPEYAYQEPSPETIYYTQEQPRSRSHLCGVQPQQINRGTAIPRAPPAFPKQTALPRQPDYQCSVERQPEDYGHQSYELSDSLSTYDYALARDTFDRELNNYLETFEYSEEPSSAPLRYPSGQNLAPMPPLPPHRLPANAAPMRSQNPKNTQSANQIPGYSQGSDMSRSSIGVRPRMVMVTPDYAARPQTGNRPPFPQHQVRPIGSYPSLQTGNRPPFPQHQVRPIGSCPSLQTGNRPPFPQHQVRPIESRPNLQTGNRPPFPQRQVYPIGSRPMFTQQVRQLNPVDHRPIFTRQPREQVNESILLCPRKPFTPFPRQQAPYSQQTPYSQHNSSPPTHHQNSVSTGTPPIKGPVYTAFEEELQASAAAKPTQNDYAADMEAKRARFVSSLYTRPTYTQKFPLPQNYANDKFPHLAHEGVEFENSYEADYYEELPYDYWGSGYDPMEDGQPLQETTVSTTTEEEDQPYMDYDPLIPETFPSKCPLCRTMVTSAAIAKDHWKGYKHRKRLKDAYARYMNGDENAFLNTFTYMTAEKTKRARMSLPGDKVCNICNVTLKCESEFMMHMLGKKHLKQAVKHNSSQNTSAVNTVVITPSQPAVSEFPQEILDFVETEVKEFETDEDTRLPTSFRSTNEILCDRCNVISRCADSHKKHLRGSKHMQTLKNEIEVNECFGATGACRICFRFVDDKLQHMVGHKMKGLFIPPFKKSQSTLQPDNLQPINFQQRDSYEQASFSSFT